MTAGFRGGTFQAGFNFEGRVNLTFPEKLNSGWETLSRKTASKKLQSQVQVKGMLNKILLNIMLLFVAVVNFGNMRLFSKATSHKEEIDALEAIPKSRQVCEEFHEKVVSKEQSMNQIKESSISRDNTLYIKQCSHCHGADGRGNGAFAKAIKNIPDFSDPIMWEKSDQQLFNAITYGRSPMPSYQKTIKEEDRWNLVYYIRTFAAKPKGK